MRKPPPASPSDSASKTPASVKAFYDRFSVEKSRHYLQEGNPRVERALARILPLVRPDSAVLEIGCSAGLVTQQIAAIATHGFVWACDISPEVIAMAISRVALPNVQFRALDAAANLNDLKTWLPRPADLIVMVDVLEHLPLNTHRELFATLSGLLDARGSVALTFPSPAYQLYLRQHNPAELQIVDEVIELPHLCQVTTPAGLVIKHFSLEDVWLPNQYVHCLLAKDQPFCPPGQPVALSLEEIAKLVPPGQKFILVDQDEWPRKAPPERQALPFLEHEGLYWGPPPDDTAALAECERLRSMGATHLVFAWPSFWWLDYYSAFAQHLRRRFPCVLHNQRLVIFDLR